MKKKLFTLLLALFAIATTARAQNTINGHGYVDLGLPSGTLWATCNVGASSPEDYGDYFAWGETSPKDFYSWKTYKWCNGSQYKLTKYCTDSSYGDNGFTDNKTVLDLEDDAAYVIWGDRWRMPTKWQQEELKNQCTWEWTQLNGVYGRKVTGPNGKSIFFPAAGWHGDMTSIRAEGTFGGCYSNEIYSSSEPYGARGFGFGSSDVSWPGGQRYGGRSIRPVIPGNQTSPFTDCTSEEDCGGKDYQGEIYKAAMYLHNLGIVEGINGKLEPNGYLTRAQLAKLALFSLYKGSANVPSTLVTDYFPSIYPDLQDNTTYYYRAAKALLYLEYKDGKSPFDRNRSYFNPTNTITRRLVLKVLCETFNIAPSTATSSNPFTDFLPSEDFYGYARKCYELGIVNTTKFRPFDDCTRGEVLLYLHRILTSTKITIPTPNNTESAATSDFFIPANFSPKNMSRLKGMESGNFNFYQKDFFNIGGYVSLDFGVTYNSCLTELPSDFYPIMPMGNAWSHTYNVYMNIVSDAGNTSKVLAFHKSDGSMLMYDGSTLKSLTEGNYFTLSKSSDSKYILTSPTKIVYTFERYSTTDGIYYLTSVKDRNGNTKTITYENGTSHRRISKVTALGRTLTFTYASGTDLVSKVTDPMGRTATFNYSNGELTSLKDAKSQTTTFNYGTSDAEKGLLTSIILPKGNKINNKYQQRKLTSTQTNNDSPTAITVTAKYSNGTTNSRVVQPVTGSQSITTDYQMDASGRLTNATDNNQTDIRMDYTDADNPTRPTRIIDNKAGITSKLTYNAKGLVTVKQISSGGLSTTERFTYNDYNDVTSYTDPNGNKTNYDYDSNGNLASVKNALGQTTNISNNSNGAPTQITDPSGKVVKMTYNSYGNLTKTNIPALSLSTSYAYDAVSRITSTTNENGQTSTYSYDKNDNVISTTNPLGHTTSYTFDANDNLTKITNAKGGVTTLTYDDDDLLTSQSFQGSTKSFTYNTDGSLASSTSPNGNTRYYSYNSSGSITDNDYAEFSYDSKGRVSSIEKDGKAIEYYYDALGRVSSVEYDGKEVEYDYDNNSNVTAITYPGNKTVTYQYDALNRVTSVTDWNSAKTTFSYNTDGSINYVQLPNKVRTTYTYDNAGRLTGIATKRNNGSGTAIAEYSYSLDNLGNHLSVSQTEPYDGIPIPDAGTTNYTYNNANRITKAGNISFGFDSNGNTTSRTGTSMQYDIVNNLTKVSGDFAATYTYDGLGQRRSATRDGVTTKYVLSGNNVVAETNSSGTVQYYYIYGPTGLIARITPSGTTRYYVGDSRGSVVAMTDATTNANVTHKYQYDDFGNVLQSQEEDANRFRYVGRHGVMHENDALAFMRARYYDPTIGRFLSEDPIWSTNLYPYADNNPIMMIDPMGNIANRSKDLVYSVTSAVGYWNYEIHLTPNGLWKFYAVDMWTGVLKQKDWEELPFWVKKHGQKAKDYLTTVDKDIKEVFRKEYDDRVFFNYNDKESHGGLDYSYRESAYILDSMQDKKLKQILLRYLNDVETNKVYKKKNKELIIYEL